MGLATAVLRKDDSAVCNTALVDNGELDTAVCCKSGGRPGMLPTKVLGANQGPRSQESPAAVLLAQKDF